MCMRERRGESERGREGEEEREGEREREGDGGRVRERSHEILTILIVTIYHKREVCLWENQLCYIFMGVG